MHYFLEQACRITGRKTQRRHHASPNPLEYPLDFGSGRNQEHKRVTTIQRPDETAVFCNRRQQKKLDDLSVS